MLEKVVGTKFALNTTKHPKHMWSLGIGISHFDDETYLFLNFFRWSIYIGKMYVEVEDFDEYYEIKKTDESGN